MTLALRHDRLRRRSPYLSMPRTRPARRGSPADPAKVPILFAKGHGLILQIVIVLGTAAVSALVGYEIGGAVWPFQPVVVAIVFGFVGLVVSLFVTGFVFNLFPPRKGPRVPPTERGERRR